jgi:FkbM family methyltransferase
MPRPGAWNADISRRQRVKDVARSIGMDVSRWRPPERRLGDFLDRHSIEVVIDAGASGGQFGRLLRRAGFTGRIISFEPLTAPFDVLSAVSADDRSWEIHRVALGNKPGRYRMNVSENSTSSSFLELNQRLGDAARESRVVSREDVVVERLDDFWSSVGLSDGRLLLKLDVQGYELPVLQGGELTVNEAVAVQCELSVVPLYEGEPGLLELLVELRDRGFDLEELEPGFYDRETGRLLQFDGRFVRTRRMETEQRQ